MRKQVLIICIVLSIVLLSGCKSEIKTEEGSISAKNGGLEIKDNENDESVFIDEDDLTFESDLSMDDSDIENMDENTQSDISDGGNDDGDNGENNLKITLKGNLNLPEGYPIDLVPLYEPVRIGLTNKFEVTSGGSGYEVQYTSGADVKTVYDYYYELLKGSEHFNEMDMDPTYGLSGFVENIAFTIMISPNLQDPNMTSLTIGIEEV